MASADHVFLSGFIKSVHQKLRDDAKLLGTEEAWQKHCEDEDGLEKYASAMQNLATSHWENNCNKGLKATSRVEWIYQFSKKYFTKEEIRKQRQKEIEIAHKINVEINYVDPNITEERKLQVLDVGSCYNPLKKYTCFGVIPIDIAPANSDVYKCDFLNLKLTPTTHCISDSEISELQQESFDMVVFSLLLEYLPSPVQRHLCCAKAYSLLKTEGILIIVTPDSKHVGANAKIMKSWRFILAKLGLSRIKYEKLSYLHCMAFRKSLHKEVAQRWALLQDEKQFFSEMVIPQDFKKFEESHNLVDSKDNCDITLFKELPCPVE
ncbi:DUF3321 and/or Methyltransf 23 domain containing protein [Asbolus verrucosus]|uniref:S-adenosylmethionine sensor upstream of mTORC1 n=1 Tax=Asbolus verrucosus TaxID=1661398 RepID=A0A482VUI2_ASBVE|nr:DUF3321 and/or Methyltransf 23 domain containing protein [Asbolus verrucosus]